MLFVKIDGKYHKDMKYPELVDFLTEHTFFKFMESGRDGLMEGATDAFDNMVVFFAVQKTGTNEKKDAQTKSAEYRQEVLLYGQKKMIDGFITRGTEGMKQGIFDMGMYIHQKMNFPQ